MRRKSSWIASLISVLVVSASLVTASDNKSVEKQLRQDLEQKVLSLRVPNASKNLRFDSSGRSIEAFSPAPWTTSALLRIKKVSLKPNTLQIECERVLVALRKTETSGGSPALAPILTGQSVRMTIDLDPTALNADQESAVLEKVFEPVDVQHRIATYWQPAAPPVPGTLSSEKGKVVGTLEGKRPVYLVKPGVIEPPKAVHAPDPEYSPAARKKRVEGTTVLMVIVNEKGVPEILEVVRDLGEGLDIEALASVSDWRFKPATRGGEAVAVMINVEVTFRLQ
jgi:TonB family protein